MINRNAEMVEDMMREFGDGPKAAKELATYCASLKKYVQYSQKETPKLNLVITNLQI